jgi:membrane-associated protein
LAASIKSWLLHLHGPLVYVVVGLLVFFEVAIVIGFFIPGEIASIIGGVIASQHHANVVLMLVVVVVAATVGNIVGFDVGRLTGPWLFSHRPLAGRAGVAEAQTLIARRARPAVVAGRFVVVVRAVLPGLVGMSGMPRRHFAVFSAIGAVLWGSLWVLVGFGLGLSYTKVTNTFGWASLVVVGLVLLAGAALWHRRRRRSAATALPKGNQEGLRPNGR